MLHWFHLPNISCRNINLMGTNIYPVVPVEIKPREDRIYALSLPTYRWVVIGFSGIKQAFFLSLSSFFFFFSCHMTCWKYLPWHSINNGPLGHVDTCKFYVEWWKFRKNCGLHSNNCFKVLHFEIILSILGVTEYNKSETI